MKVINVILITIIVTYSVFAVLRMSSEPVRRRGFYNSGNIYDEPVVSGLNGSLSSRHPILRWKGFLPNQTSSFLSTNTQINPIDKDKTENHYEIMTSNDIFIDDHIAYELCDASTFHYNPADTLKSTHANSLLLSGHSTDDYNIYSNESTDGEYLET
ncbi:hypothetical protein RF11_08502 [Thelohanellus kitauei]|uniref:Uncharacterized protein n=1 Tax=Thelohanellus kitauei TaxID=669202 RepID=A0A0C2J8W8_THEKT|nr:hypothetical protein RF11_08502 [Thelohanellus kitauei]